MTVRDWLKEARDDYEEYGLLSLKYTSQELFHGLLSRLGYWFNYGDDHYDYDWDLLILLDACRWDLMAEVAPEYDWIDTSDDMIVHSSHSREWLHKTYKRNAQTGLSRGRVWYEVMRNPDKDEIFTEWYEMKDEEYIRNTAYITWNVFAGMLEEEAFYEFVPVGRAKWGDNTDILDPREITDPTIDLMRRESPERTVVHYMQPHTPFRNSDGTDFSGSVWERIQRGEKEYEEAWSEYKDNLRWVLDDVELLLENADAERVVISSDHGNVIGEWGCYGHRPYVPLPAVKRVPFVTTTAVDQRTYIPEVEDTESASDEEINERLRALGYK